MPWLARYFVGASKPAHHFLDEPQKGPFQNSGGPGNPGGPGGLSGSGSPSSGNEGAVSGGLSGGSIFILKKTIYYL